MKTLTLFIFSIFLSSASFSQNVPDHRTCGTDSVHAYLMGLPGYMDAWRERADAVEENLMNISNRSQCNNPLVIPVAVHFQGTGIPLSCAIDMALSQVDAMNLDYAGTNVDIGNWNTLQPAQWPAISNGESCICFCLATLNHPAGFGLNDGDYAVTIDQTTGDNDPAWSGYMNFWIRTIGSGTLGYSPLGGMGNGDGVTIDPAFFGTVSCGANTISPPFNLGRTATHEVGHYLLLEHPWGGSGCSSTDNVLDTPVTDNPQFGCPTTEIINCTEPILWPTYMEYCDDACLFMFSQGQVERMETYVTQSLTNLTGNSVTVCQEAACLDFAVTVTSTDESCAGSDGSISFIAIGGAGPYNYSINGGATLTNLDTFNALQEFNYDVYVIDDNGCEFVATENVGRTPPTISIMNVNHEYCSDATGSFDVAVAEGSGFQYSLDGGFNWQNSPNFVNLSAGVYTVSVQNSVGCNGTEQVVIDNQSNLDVFVDNLSPINCTWFDNGSIKMHAINGLDPYIYTLDGTFESSVGNFNGLSEGPHSIYITDANGCVMDYPFTVGRTFATIATDCPCQLYVPNAISPDGDNQNEILVVVPSCPIIDFHMLIYNRWGDIVFETFDPNIMWNGGVLGYFVEADVFGYRMTWRWGDSNSSAVEFQSKFGSILVIR